jgi:hypothetical protein
MGASRVSHPTKRGSGPYFRRAHVKIQSVSHACFENESGSPQTLGQAIDELLNRESEDGRFPNKLILEINPPEEPDMHRMEDE